ncbi:hypothetical protein UPYG_G00196310 [Umbra pygmaea]|uniref:Uncharacterized protein n=1 Tax=Umbra pygmaea TaxID=75934 RepID=A0ABD0WH88_UMBPY
MTRKRAAVVFLKGVTDVPASQIPWSPVTTHGPHPLFQRSHRASREHPGRRCNWARPQPAGTVMCVGGEGHRFSKACVGLMSLPPTPQPGWRCLP